MAEQAADPGTWELRQESDGRVLAIRRGGDNHGEILEWASATVLIDGWREGWRRLGNVAAAIGLQKEWENA